MSRLSTPWTFNETRAPRASLELIAHGVRPDGILSLCYPMGGDAPIPAFSCMYFVQMEEYIRYSGDTSLAEEHFDKLDTIINTFHKKIQTDGVIENFYGPGYNGKNEYWNFYEWQPLLDGGACLLAGLQLGLLAFVLVQVSSISRGRLLALGNDLLQGLVRPRHNYEDI